MVATVLMTRYLWRELQLALAIHASPNMLCGRDLAVVETLPENLGFHLARAAAACMSSNCD